MAIDARSAIFVAGFTSAGRNGTEDFAIASFTSAGNLNAGFDGDGKATYDLGGLDRAYALTVLSDGKLVVAGRTMVVGADMNFGAIRIHPDGALDTNADADPAEAFGGAGIVTANFSGGSEDELFAVAQISNNRLLLVGSTNYSGRLEIALMQLQADGTLDPNFNGDRNIAVIGAGKASAGALFSDELEGAAVAINRTGQIVVAGRSGSSGDDFAVFRFNRNGSPDDDKDGTRTVVFGNNGLAVTEFSAGAEDGAGGVAIAADGKIVAAGYTMPLGGPPEKKNFAVVRYIGDSDSDFDGIENGSDNCPLVASADQTDTDHDGQGDACDADDDGDGAADAQDNCPLEANADQGNIDGDALGDVCDPDYDGDRVPDALDNCPGVPNADQKDVDRDRIGDACDANIDNDKDGIDNGADNCVDAANADQKDTDGDHEGDLCDADDDDDGVLDGADNSPLNANADQKDSDGDRIGDASDPDDDNDAVADRVDNAPLVPNADQKDSDKDGIGDVIDPVAPVAGGENASPVGGGPAPAPGDGGGVVPPPPVDGGGVVPAPSGTPSGPGLVPGPGRDGGGGCALIIR